MPLLRLRLLFAGLVATCICWTISQMLVLERHLSATDSSAAQAHHDPAAAGVAAAPAAEELRRTLKALSSLQPHVPTQGAAAAAAHASAASASVTAVLEWRDAAQLERQLEALSAQRPAAPATTLVDAYRAADGGAAARAVARSFGGGSSVSVFGAVTSGGGGGGERPGGAMGGRLGRLALALQEPSAFVLLLDSHVTPGPAAVEALLAASLGSGGAVGRTGLSLLPLIS